MRKRLAVDIAGIVQGVGFRPFVYRLARRYHLTGFVRNDPRGVSIEVQGRARDAASFLNALPVQVPPLAQITRIASRELPLIPGEADFEIGRSDEEPGVLTLVSPDISTCADCLNEFHDPADRRYHYPFINCTNCGPRYTIIQDIPYDRRSTTMRSFDMCPDCLSEYHDPADRRFHAQPNACPVCGPVPGMDDVHDRRTPDDVVRLVATALQQGRIIAIKGLGGYHLAVDAASPQAVAELRRRKHRFEKPLALMVRDIQSAEEICYLSPEDRTLLLSLNRPIVLCRRKPEAPVAADVSPDNIYLGLMLPYTPLHELIFTIGDFRYLVMTSANISEEPICYKDDECRRKMAEIADHFLIHDRRINIRCDDSVALNHRGEPFFLRRSRGYAPRPVMLASSGRSVLAVGAHLKNTVCLTRDRYAFMSQHIGDLENLETLEVFRQTISHLQRLFEISPQLVVHDLHPDYLSTKWAIEDQDLPVAPVQHHYAHILSVMAEQGITEPVIGLAMDGTGYGTDGTIWGGEILVAGIREFQRCAHLARAAMPGGERAIREPWRMAASYLYQCNGRESLSRLFPDRPEEIRLIGQMIDKEINCPQTSSCGRLFDAVAAVLNIRHRVSYEGQAAIGLETAAAGWNGSEPHILAPMELRQENGIHILDWREMFRSIIDCVQRNTDPARIAQDFHSRLAHGLAAAARRVADETGLRRIALSGGCFQNMILLSLLQDRLEADGFTVMTNRQVPVNDGGIALGQAYWGMHHHLDSER